MRSGDELKGNLHLLVPLRALLEERGVTAAAVRMGVSQPAMSRTLVQLRALFQDPLLVRAGAGMQLTPRAEALLEPLCRILESTRDLIEASPFEPQAASRTFRGVVPDVLAAPLLPQLLAGLAEEAPGCRLHLLPWSTGLAAAADLDFVITSEVDHFPMLQLQPLGQDRDVLVRAEPPPSGTDVLELDHVAVIAAGADEDPVDAWLRTLGRTRRVTTVVPSYLLALVLVARTGCCAILPSRLVAALGAEHAVAGYPLPFDQQPDQMWLLYPPRLQADPASRWLRDFVARRYGADDKLA